MVTSQAKTVGEYVKTCDARARPAIVAFRRLVKKAAPKAEESMAYGMPTYLLGGPLVAFNAQKNYLSFYVCHTDIVAAHKQELGRLDCGKSCLRGRKLEDFPLRVLERMVRESAKKAEAR
jgi:uncharacterized protein YdhG (YjbR/CyaY superfamily)